jgi:hypothetical protein
MTQTRTSPADRAKARIGTYPIRQLVEALVTIDEAPSSPENSTIRHWMIDEVERRYPAASDAVQAAFHASEMEEELTGEQGPAVDYVAVLVANIPPANLA